MLIFNYNVKLCVIHVLAMLPVAIHFPGAYNTK